MTSAKRARNEAGQFFAISQELRDPETSDAGILHRLEELEGIRMHTASALMRQRCTALIALFDPDPAAVAANDTHA